MAIAAVTGLAAEAEIARGVGIAAVACGGDASRAAAAAERFIVEGAEGLVSFGIAGGLLPGLASGTLVLPRAVRDEAGAVYAADPAWRARVRAALPTEPAEGDILGAAAIAFSAAEKAALHAKTGAVAVDLESHVVAAAARRAGRPFIVLRAIADPASRSLPQAVAVGLDAEGRATLGPVALSVLRRPGQIAALLRLACDSRRALRALARAAEALR